MFVPGDEVQITARKHESYEKIGWVLRVLTGEEQVHVFFSDGSFAQGLNYADVHLEKRYSPLVRQNISLLVQTCVRNDIMEPPNLDSADIEESMRNLINGAKTQIPMNDHNFRETCKRVDDLEKVYQRIHNLEEKIIELDTPDKNRTWLLQQKVTLEQDIEDLRDKISGLNVQIRDKNEDIARLEEMNQKFVSGYKKFLQQKELLVSTSQTLDSQKRELEDHLFKEKNVTNKLASDLAHRSQQIASLDSKNSELDRILVETKDMWKNEINRREEMQIKIANLEKNNADLLSQLELLISANRELQQGVRSWRTQNQEIFSTLTNLSSRSRKGTVPSAE